MIRTTNFEGAPCREGRDIIREIISRRMDEGLIEEAARSMLVEKTGGALRDVFEVLVVAGGAAESLHDRNKQDPIITEQNIRYGLDRRRNEYKRSVSTLGLPENWEVTSTELWKRLESFEGKAVKFLQTDLINMILLRSRAVLEYNGEGWFRVHPLVEEILELQRT